MVQFGNKISVSKTTDMNLKTTFKASDVEHL